MEIIVFGIEKECREMIEVILSIKEAFLEKIKMIIVEGIGEEIVIMIGEMAFRGKEIIIMIIETIEIVGEITNNLVMKEGDRNPG